MENSSEQGIIILGVGPVAYLEALVAMATLPHGLVLSESAESLALQSLPNYVKELPSLVIEDFSRDYAFFVQNEIPKYKPFMQKTYSSPAPAKVQYKRMQHK